MRGDLWCTSAKRSFSRVTRFPPIWHVGGFELEIAELTDGRLDKARVLRGAAGTAWLHLPCARPVFHAAWALEHPELSPITHAVEVVADVLHPQTQIRLAEAQQLRPDAAIGDTISLNLAVDRAVLQGIVERGRGVRDWFDSDPRANRFAVEFSDLTVNLEEAERGVGRVVEGLVTYPVAGPLRRPIEIVIDGFVLVLSSLGLSPRGSTAVAQVQLPGGLTDVDSCKPASIDLGRITISPSCDFYVDAPGQAYGPWLLGDTGMVIEGTGYVLDLSTATSPAPWSPAWRGLVLGAGTATGEKYVPDPCNTGYLRGHYTYNNAIVVSSGFFGSLYLAEQVTFAAINPLGQTFAFNDGAMDVWYSRIVRGELKNGWTELPIDAVCERRPGRRVKTPIDVVSIQPDLDLAGALDHGMREISWGELTRHGDEVVAWTGIFGPGYLYLPAGPDESFSPVATGTFTESGHRLGPRQQPGRARGLPRGRRFVPVAARRPGVLTRPARRPRQPDQAPPAARLAPGRRHRRGRRAVHVPPDANLRTSGTRGAPVTSATSRSTRRCSSTTSRTCWPSSPRVRASTRTSPAASRSPRRATSRGSTSRR